MIDGHAMSVQLGDVTYGETNEIVVELARRRRRTARMSKRSTRSSTGPTERREREESTFLGAKATTDEAKIGAGKVKDVADAVSRAQDAAATLKKIEEERAIQNRANGGAANGSAMPSPVTAAPPPKSCERAAPLHDVAIQNFQTH